MRILTSLLSAALITLGGVAQAQENFQGLETIGKPAPMGIGFQFPATELMRDIVWLDNFLLIIIDGHFGVCDLSCWLMRRS